LRARLDALWSDAALPNKDDAAVEADLDVVARGIQPDFLLQTMLRAYRAALAESRARLDNIVPRWLQSRNHLPVLGKMIARRELESDLMPPALVWLQASGVDTKAWAQAPEEMFYRAYYFDDIELLGELSQAVVFVFWYTSPRKNRVQGMNFLLDYNPPWDGAVKDITLFPQVTPQDMLTRFVKRWEERGQDLRPVSASEAKTRILAALQCSRKSNIRLPRDLITTREIFVRNVLSLPDGADTPRLTLADLDYMTKNGQTPEEIMHIEQTVGRRVRMKDGKELWVLGGPGWDDEE
jgi:hypothetical protein